MTVYHAGERGDAIRVKSSGVEVPMLAVAGAVPGVTVLAASGKNDPASSPGSVRHQVGGLLSWKAPGSSTYGTAIAPPVDGAYVLEDGDDADQWVRVQVATSYLPAGDAVALVYMQGVFNAAGPDDVTAAEASAGDVASWTLTLENVGVPDVRNLVAWIDAGVSGLEISDDGAVWVAPTTEGTALALATPLVSGGTDTLHLRRTISAAAASDPDVEHLVHLSWEGL